MCFFLFFSMLFQIVLVICDFVGGSPFPYDSWQDWQDHRPTHNPVHAGFHPHTIMNQFYLNNERLANFHFWLPFWGLLLEFLPLFWFSACYLLPVATFLLIVVFWQVSWLFSVFSFCCIARPIFILFFHFWGFLVDFLPLFDFVNLFKSKENNVVRNPYKTVSSGTGEPTREYSFLYT